MSRPSKKLEHEKLSWAERDILRIKNTCLKIEVHFWTLYKKACEIGRTLKEIREGKRGKKQG